MFICIPGYLGRGAKLFHQDDANLFVNAPLFHDELSTQDPGKCTCNKFTKP